MKPEIKNDKWFLDQIELGRLKCSKSGNVLKTETGKKTLSNDKNNYIHVVLKDDDGRYRHIVLHRLIWIYFNGLIPENIQINHIDGIKGHCALSNLELVTNAENVKHAYMNNLLSVSKKARNLSRNRWTGEKNTNAKFTDKQVLKLRKDFRNKSLSVDDIYEKFGHTISKRAIKNMLFGISYQHLECSVQKTDKQERNLKVKQLFLSGKSKSEIAKKLDINRETVRIILKNSGSKCS